MSEIILLCAVKMLVNLALPALLSQPIVSSSHIHNYAGGAAFVEYFISFRTRRGGTIHEDGGGVLLVTAYYLSMGLQYL